MSLLHLQYFSQALSKQSALYATVPDGEGPFPVVYLLHGLSDDYTIWQRRTSIERYAEDAGVMVVMLDGARSFYCDMKGSPGNYEQHILESVRVIDRLLPTIPTAQGRAIGGLSMGGYGCMKLGLKYPELFGSVAAHSGALDANAMLGNRDFTEIHAVFGDVLDPADDCFALAARPGPKPALYFDCGVEDFLLAHNRDFHAHLQRLQIAHTYHEFPGSHNWEYWDLHIREALAFHCVHFNAREGRV